jgi:hypothetical protein
MSEASTPMHRPSRGRAWPLRPGPQGHEEKS